MYDDRTYNNIMAEMMSYMPDGVDTQEGSLIYNACSKMALKLEEKYMSDQYLYDNMIPTKMDEEHLIPYAINERGITIKEATYAVLQAEFKQEIPLLSRFCLNDLNYIITEKISNYIYKIECETAGKVGNSYFGQLSPISYIDNWQGGEIVKVLIPGEDEPTLEEIREEVLNSYTAKEFAGNKADYKKKINALQGVGGCKTKRRDKTSGYINIHIISSEFKVPEQELIKFVQDAVDPETSHGEGDGLAAIGQAVLIHGAEAVRINVTAHIEFADSQTYEDMKSYIESAIDNYFLELAKQWEDTENLVVKIYQIITSLSAIENIVDITNVQLNGASDNIILERNQIPERGEINVI